MSRSVQAVDLYVGARIAARRTSLGLAQSALAQRLGVSPQQVQKYEAGTNRISASRLSLIAVALGAAPGDFFPETERETGRADISPAALRFISATTEGRAVAQAFPVIEDRKVRQALACIVEALAAA